MDIANVAEAIAKAYAPQGAGRPSAIADASTLQVFLTELEQGVHMEPAAQLAGLAPNTVRNWLKRGEEGEVPFDLFLRAFKRAQGAIESRVTKNIIAASHDPKFWAAGATYLERTHPDRWARRNDDSASGPRVVVNIGVKDSDVQVSVGEGWVSPVTFAPDAQRKDDAKLLTDSAYAVSSCPINGDYVNAGSEGVSQPIQNPAHELDGAPLPVGGGSKARVAVPSVKASRGGRKKKG